MDWSTDPTVAAAYFAHRLTVETDVSDVHAALESGDPGFVLVDVRSREAWDQGHVPGAVHAPGGDLVTDGPVVVRLNPADLERIPESALAQVPDHVRVVGDPAVEPAGAIADAGVSRVDAQLGPALQRVREVLGA